MKRKLRAIAQTGLRTRLGLLALVALGGPFSTPAVAKVDDAVREALARHSAGQPDVAFAQLAPLEDERAGDPDYDYALGLAAADSGRTGVAIAAFQRVIAVQPGNAQARAELARVYAMAGDLETARAEFSTVIDDPSVPDPVRQRLNGLMRGLDRRGPRSVTGFAEIEGGYDSNVNAATSATSITLPVFAFLGPAALGGNALRTGEGFVQAQGGLSGETAVGAQTKLYASAFGVLRDVIDSKAFDQAALTGTAGLAHTLANRDVFSLSGQAQQFWLGQSAYRTSFAGIGQYTRRLAEDRALTVAVQVAKLDDRSDRLRDATRYAATLGYVGRTVYASAGAGVEDTRRAAGRYLGFAFAAGQVGIEQPVARRVAVLAGLGIEHRDYRSSDPLFLEGRRDTQFDAQAGLRFALTRNLSIRPRVTYTRNQSNLALYDYERVTGSVALRAEF